jgi:hypothetical protein
LRALLMLARVCTFSSPVREREKKIDNYRERGRERKIEREKEREKDR